MGKIEKGVLGGFSGLVGTVVGAKFRGIDVIRSRPVKSKKPPKQSMLDQRSKFALITKFLKRIKSWVDLGFSAGGTTASPMNLAVALNLERAIKGISPAFSIDYTKLVLSNGELPVLENLSVTPAAARTLNFTWNEYEDWESNEERTVLRNTDRVSFLLHNPVTNSSLKGLLTGNRGMLAGKTFMSLAMMGAPCHLWTFVTSEDGMSISESQYLGTVTGLA